MPVYVGTRSKIQDLKTRMKEKRRKGRKKDNVLDMKENSLCLQNTLVNQEPLAIRRLELDIAHSTIENWGTVVAHIAVCKRCVGWCGGSWDDWGTEVIFVHLEVLFVTLVILLVSALYSEIG